MKSSYCSEVLLTLSLTNEFMVLSFILFKQTSYLLHYSPPPDPVHHMSELKNSYILWLQSKCTALPSQILIDSSFILLPFHLCSFKIKTKYRTGKINKLKTADINPWDFYLSAQKLIKNEKQASIRSPQEQHYFLQVPLNWGPYLTLCMIFLYLDRFIRKNITLKQGESHMYHSSLPKHLSYLIGQVFPTYKLDIKLIWLQRKV